jgi:hypothetical protein
MRAALWLAEGHLCRGDRGAARPLIDSVLETSRPTGYLHYEALAHWLMGECLAPDGPAEAEPHIDAATEVLGRIGARNDLARAMLTGARLRQDRGDIAAARGLLAQAGAIFQALGTLDGPLQVTAARTALDRGAPIALLDGGS